MLPRVGEPKATKCVLYLDRGKLVLSDCVYAIRCKSVSDARQLKICLLEAWKTVEASYKGTCARHLTLPGLRELLQHLGFDVALDR